jgi:hypothetical protein
VPLTDDADVYLLIDGKRCDAIERHDDRVSFRLPAAPCNVRLRSRAGVPQELGLARDPRPLGVAVRRILLAQPEQPRVIEADDVRLSDGFHAYEVTDQIRWTNGDAALPAELFAGVIDTCTLTVQLGGSTQYPDEGDVFRVA